MIAPWLMMSRSSRKGVYDIDLMLSSTQYLAAEITRCSRLRVPAASIIIKGIGNTVGSDQGKAILHQALLSVDPLFARSNGASSTA